MHDQHTLGKRLTLRSFEFLNKYSALNLKMKNRKVLSPKSVDENNTYTDLQTAKNVMISFLKRILLKGSSLIKHITAMAQHNPFSVYWYNCNELADKYGANCDLCTKRNVNEWNNSINEMEMSNVNVLKEMIGIHDIRDWRMICLILSRENVLYITDDVFLN